MFSTNHYGVFSDRILCSTQKLKNGKAKVRANVKANGKKIFTISGKDFRSLNIRKTKGGKFNYKIRRGNEFLSSGHATGSNIKLSSDGQSVNSIVIISEENKNRRIELSFINDGSEPF